MGTSFKIEAENMVEAINKLRKSLDEGEKIGLYLDSISIFIKDNNGEYSGIGDNGIEVSVNTLFGEKPTKKVVILCHLD